MKNAFLFIIFCFGMMLPAQAQSDTIFLANCEVLDGFYETPLSKAHVSVLERDSLTVLVDSMRFTYMFLADVPRREEYVLRIECEGYPLTYEHIRIPKGTKYKYNLPNPIYIYQMRESELGEAEVTASRILMVVKGDTVEYNAAAFRLSEGSMLDNLVRALPGAKLDDNGRITMNGEFVSSLLVNGRDFFDGDPRVALRNLPAYTVGKIKTYHKSERAALMGKKELTEEELKDAPLVMDVVLKREYARGWISNYEIGGGSGITGDGGKKWMGRLFAMRYTNHSSIAIFGGSNNLNDGLEAGSKGEWKKPDVTDGENRNHMAGINITLNPKDVPIEFSTSMRINLKRHVGDIRSTAENFYTSVTTFMKSRARNLSNNTDFGWNGNLTWNRKMRVSFKPYVSYGYVRGNSKTSENKSQTISGAGVDTLYKRNISELMCGRTWRTGASLWGTAFFNNFKTLAFSQNLSYNRTRRQCLTDDGLLYADPERESYREYRDRSTPLSGYDYSGSVTFQGPLVMDLKNYSPNKFQLDLNVQYKYDRRYNSARQELLRSSDDGLVPSAEESRIWLLDPRNSYRTSNLSQLHSLAPTIRIGWEGFRLSAGMEAGAHNRFVNDFRDGSRRKKRSKDLTLAPNLSLGWGNKVHNAELGGGMSTELPEMLYLIDVQDNADPMKVQVGNPDLKPTRRQNAYFTYRANMKRHAQRLNLSLSFNRWNDRVSVAQLYDGNSGVTTFMPMNVDGNKAFDATSAYTISIGRKGNWSVSNELGYRYARSVDYSSAQSGGVADRQAVRNSVVKEDFRLDYRIKDMRIGLKAAFSWTGQTSEQHLFTRLTYGMQSYGVVFATPLVWGIDLDTDFMVYKRFGYDDASMNTTECVWNASLSRAFGKRKQWVAKAVGFDILHQLSNIRRDINAQGYTERRYNTMPSYVMFSLVYRLDIKPKKDK